MEYFRFTLFNTITLFLMALTLLVALGRFTGRLDSNWPLAYYAFVAGYSFVFARGLNWYWVLAGIACGVLVRFGFYYKKVRLAETVVLAYILWRCLGLILLW